MIPAQYIIGFCGHRSGFDESALRSTVATLLADLSSRVASHDGVLSVCSSAAEGADLVFVQEASAAGLAVHLLLPLPEADFAADFSSPEAWKQARDLLDPANHPKGRVSVQVVPGEAARPQCYFNQAAWMLESVDVLVAVWDGMPARGMGGTAEVVAMAQARGMPVVHVNPQDGSVAILGELERALAPDPLMRELKHMSNLQSRAPGLKVAGPGELQQMLDDVALAESSQLRPSLVRVIMLHGMAALLATVVLFKAPESAAWDKFKPWVTSIEFAMVTLAWWMVSRLHRRHSQERWIRCRFACELVRGLRSCLPLLDPLQPEVARHEPMWRRFAVSAGIFIVSHADTDDPVVLRDRYLERRLGDKHSDGQIRHFGAMAPSAARLWVWTGTIADWSGKLAPPVVLLALLTKAFKHWEPVEALHLDKQFASWLIVAFLPIALPLIAGMATGLRQALDTGRRKDRYPQMIARLSEIKAVLPTLRTPSTIRHAVGRSEEILLDELLEWELAMRNTSH